MYEKKKSMKKDAHSVRMIHADTPVVHNQTIRLAFCKEW